MYKVWLRSWLRRGPSVRGTCIKSVFYIYVCVYIYGWNKSYLYTIFIHYPTLHTLIDCALTLCASRVSISSSLCADLPLSLCCMCVYVSVCVLIFSLSAACVCAHSSRSEHQSYLLSRWMCMVIVCSLMLKLYVCFDLFYVCLVWLRSWRRQTRAPSTRRRCVRGTCLLS